MATAAFAALGIVAAITGYGAYAAKDREGKQPVDVQVSNLQTLLKATEDAKRKAESELQKQKKEVTVLSKELGTIKKAKDGLEQEKTKSTEGERLYKSLSIAALKQAVKDLRSNDTIIGAENGLDISKRDAIKKVFQDLESLSMFSTSRGSIQTLYQNLTKAAGQEFMNREEFERIFTEILRTADVSLTKAQSEQKAKDTERKLTQKAEKDKENERKKTQRNKPAPKVTPEQEADASIPGELEEQRQPPSSVDGEKLYKSITLPALKQSIKELRKRDEIVEVMSGVSDEQSAAVNKVFDGIEKLTTFSLSRGSIDKLYKSLSKAIGRDFMKREEFERIFSEILQKEEAAILTAKSQEADRKTTLRAEKSRGAQEEKERRTTARAEKARMSLEEKARKKAEDAEKTKLAAEEKARKKAEDTEKAKLAGEEKANKANLAAEEKARKKAEDTEKAKLAGEEKANKANLAAEEKARKKAEDAEKTKLAAEEKANKANLAAEEKANKAKLAGEEKARKKVEDAEKANLAAEEKANKAKLAGEEKARKKAEEEERKKALKSPGALAASEAIRKATGKRGGRKFGIRRRTRRKSRKVIRIR